MPITNFTVYALSVAAPPVEDLIGDLAAPVAVVAYRASTLPPKVEDELKSAGVEGDAPRRRRGRWWVGAGLAVVAIAIAAIVVAQDGGSSGGPLNAIAKAAEVTQREPGGRAKVKAVVTAANTAEGLTETGSMVFDDSGRADGNFTVKGHSTGKEAQLTTIVDGTTVYTSSDSLDSIPEGKKWMEIDLSAASPEIASSTPADGGPQEGLKILEKVEGAEEVGKEAVEGVPTTHYRGTLPTSKEVFGVKLHVSPPQTDVWIDAQNRVRRMVLVVSGTVGESELSTTTEETIDFVEFGQMPKIKAPPADEVFNATSEIESAVQKAGKSN
jgi:LppX_LprAFG lipoprotein